MPPAVHDAGPEASGETWTCNPKHVKPISSTLFPPKSKINYLPPFPLAIFTVSFHDSGKLKSINKLKRGGQGTESCWIPVLLPKKADLGLFLITDGYKDLNYCTVLSDIN